MSEPSTDANTQPVESPAGQHGGVPLKPDDEAYERRVEEERAALGDTPYGATNVPPATSETVEVDVTETAEYQEELDAVRDRAAGADPDADFPPSSYDS